MTVRGGASTGVGGNQDLSAQEYDLRSLVEHVPLILALLDPDGTILYANPAALATGEVVETDVIGRKLWNTGYWPDAAERTRLEQLIYRAAAGSAVRDETPITPPSGRFLRIEFSLTPVLGADGHPSLIAMEARDVTAARTAELELRLSREKYQGIVSISADAVITIDEQQRILEYNAGAASIFGWTAAEVVGQRLDVLIPEPLREAHRQHVIRFGAGPVVARRMGERREISGLRKDGTTFPADASISKLDVDGQRIYNVVLRDITAIQRSASGQEFLARAGALLASSLDVDTTRTSIAELIVEDLADCAVIYEVETSDVVRRVSMAAATESMLPVIEELRSRPVRSETRHPVMAVIETGESELLTEIGSWWTEDADSDPDLRLFRELPVHSAMIVPLNARGLTTGAIGFFRAPTRPAYDAEDLHIASELGRRAALALDSARLYRAATDAIRARDDVLSVVSHDLGNPISAIRIGVSLLLRSRARQDQPGEGWEHLAGIKQSVEQMERLIRDLLEVKRIEAGHLTLNHEYVTAASLFDDMAGLMGALARSHDMALTTWVEPGLPLVRADRERILQVLSNLVGNAIKFTPAGGTIDVEARKAGGEVVISVRDNGPGIEARHLDQIFDRFWQAHRDRREGIGLGLAIVRSIVEAHGGRVWAASEIGKGTTICFTLFAAPDEREGGTDPPSTRTGIA